MSKIKTSFISPLDELAANATATYRGILKDDSVPPVFVPASAFSSVTLSVVHTVTRAVVNSISAVNILNAGRGTIDASGNLIVTLAPADMVLLDTTLSQEPHSIVIDFVYGAKTGRHQVDFLVVALAGP